MKFTSGFGKIASPEFFVLTLLPYRKLFDHVPLNSLKIMVSFLFACLAFVDVCAGVQSVVFLLQYPSYKLWLSIWHTVCTL